MEQEKNTGTGFNLNILLTIVIFLFLIGLLTFLFVIFNSEIKDATSVAGTGGNQTINPSLASLINPNGAFVNFFGENSSLWINPTYMIDGNPSTYAIINETENSINQDDSGWAGGSLYFNITLGTTNISKVYLYVLYNNSVQLQYNPVDLSNCNINNGQLGVVIVSSIQNETGGEWSAENDIGCYKVGSSIETAPIPSDYGYYMGVVQLSPIAKTPLPPTFVRINEVYAVVVNEGTPAQLSQAGQVADDVNTALSSTTSFFAIIIVIGAMVVLILLTILIINAIRGSGFISA